MKDAPTGTVSVMVDAQGQPSYVLHRPAAYDFAALPEEPDMPEWPEWLYHGTLHFMEPRIYALRHCYPDARRFYDINLRKDSYTAPLVMELLHLADVVKLNDDELVQVQQMIGTSHTSIEDFCRRLPRRASRWDAVCVTRGERGCAILKGDEYVEVPGVPVQVGRHRRCGRCAFATAAFLHGLDQELARGKNRRIRYNRLGALVGQAVPGWAFPSGL